ncbi:hypothetical protein Hte_003846 [Hypoxylon texense]
MNQQPSRTIAQLWGEAIEEYKKELEEDTGPRKSPKSTPSKTPSKSADLAVMTLQEKGQDVNRLFSDVLSKYFGYSHLNFKHTRHPATRRDRIRTIFRNVCNQAQDAVGLASDLASLAYPPASAISQALFFILKACKDLSEKLDEIEKFYEKIQYFFERLSLIERRLPPEHAFGEPLIRVFIAILNVCGTARRYARDGRAITFLKSLVGKDDGLADHLKDITNRMNDLESSVIMATLNTVTQAKGDVELLVGTMKAFLQRISSPNLQGTGFIEDRESPQSILSNRRTWLPDISDNDRGSQNFEAFTKILSQLSSDTEIPLREWMKEMERRYVKGTCVWVESELSQLSFEGNNAVQCIHITGKRGTGKSMLTFYVYCYLKHLYQSMPSSHYVVVYFSFGIESGKVRSLEDMFTHCIVQIAEEDELSRARIQKRLALSSSPPKPIDLFKYTLSHKCSFKRVFIIIDGSDQLEEREQQELDKTIELTFEGLPATFVVSATEIPNRGQPTIVLEGGILRSELSLFTKSRLETLPRLRMLPTQTKVKIAEEVGGRADSFLYVDYTLHQLNANIHGLLSQLKGLDTTELIFKALFDACFDGRTPLERLQIHCLFVWLIYTKGYMSLGAASMLMSIISGWEIPEDLPGTHSANPNPGRGFSVHREIDTRLARILVFSAIPTEAPTSLDDMTRKDEDGSDDFNVTFGFSAPSLQDYYRTQYIPSFEYSGDFLMLNMAISILTVKAEGGDMPMTTQTRLRAEGELVSYASGSWQNYMSIETKSVVLRENGIKLVSKLMRNENGAMRRLEERCRAKNPLRLSILCNDGFEQLEILCRDVSFETDEDAGARDLVEQVSLGSRAYSLYVAKKHVQSWWAAETPLEAYTSFRFARQAVSDAFSMVREYEDYQRFLSNLDPKLKTASLGEIDENDEKLQIKLLSETLGNWHDSCSQDCKYNMREECKRATQLRCRAMALRFSGHYEKALDDINEALSCRKIERGEEWKFKLLERKGRILFGQSEDVNGLNPESYPQGGNCEAALKGALKAFGGALYVIPEDTGRYYGEKTFMIHQMSAKAAAALGKIDDCLKSVALATRDTPYRRLQVLVYFKDIVSILAENRHWEKIIELLSKVPKQQLAAGCTPQTYEALHLATARAKEASYPLLDNMYKESVEALHNGLMSVAANSVRVWWAIFKRHVQGDSVEAKHILQHVLKSSGNEVSVQTITSASWQLGEILLGEFYDTDSSATKESVGKMLARREKIHGRMEQLVRIVTNLVPNFQHELSQTSILLALMEVGMGSMKSAQYQANAIFDACYEALTDDKASNDPLGFQMLAKILAVVPALMEDAKKAASYQFYIVDEQRYQQEPQELDAYSPDDGYDPILSLEQEAQPDRRNSYQSSHPRIPKTGRREHFEDYAAFHAVKCGGSCGRVIGPNIKTAYLCYYCTNTTLCKECYRSRGGSQHEWRVRCPAYHRHIEFPFLKVKEATEEDRVLSKEEVAELRVWLERLRGKWNKAWIEFVQIALSDDIREDQATKRQRIA